ncbi:MAG: IS3 family transposase [Alphaproteobacteria bacterium]
MTRRKFSREFKVEAVRLVTDRGVAVAQAARDLDVADSVLRRWMRELTAAPVAAFPGNGQMRADLAEIAALKKEVARLRAERDILKKAGSFFRARGDMRFAFIAKHRHIWPVSWLCEVLEVSRSGFHAWLSRPTSIREIHDAKLVLAIETSFKASDRTYGARRIWRDVLEEGLACGLHRIERLMRLNALRARPRRRGKPRDDGERSVIADNILDRDFQAARPNQKWLADFTYIWTAEGWLYVAVVLDLFSRRVVGWSMKADRDASLVMDALMMAVWRRGKADALLHHSDQGSQYTSEQFQRLLADNAITCSMSRAGNVWDNSAMESFFSSLKTERIARKVYRTRDEARANVFDYIERFYNPRRRHSKLGYLSPMAFEAQAMQT